MDFIIGMTCNTYCIRIETNFNSDSQQNKAVYGNLNCHLKTCPRMITQKFFSLYSSMNYLYPPVTSLNTSCCKDTMITSFISKYVDIEFFFFRIRVTMKWYGAYMQSD